MFFADPNSPWQRGTNENTNGLLRQYFPKGTDLSRWSAQEIQAVAHTLNSRPRKTLGWKTPAEALNDYLKSIQQPLLQRPVESTQYASREHRKLLEIHGFVGSMSRTGDCFDNAVAESFFGSLKQEQIHWRHYQTRFSAQQDVLQYISMFYNTHQLHSYLGYKSPNQYEVEIENLKKVA